MDEPVIGVDADLRASWDRLAGDRGIYNTGTGDLKVLRPVALVSRPYLAYLGLDGTGRRHFLVQVPDEREVVADVESAGVHLVERSLVLRGKMHKYVDLICNKPHQNDLFASFCADVIRQLDRSDISTDSACHVALKEWRELFAGLRIGRALGPDRTEGLFGELWALRELTGLGASIDIWTGPRGERHDFRNGRWALEVKTTTRPAPYRISVNGIDQLEAPAEGQLWLLTLEVRTHPTQGLEESRFVSAADLVDDICARTGQRTSLHTLLQSFGAQSEDLASLKETRFAPVLRSLFSVSEGFPRLVRESLRSGALPPGVSGLRYEIQIAPDSPASLDDASSEHALTMVARG